MAIIKCEMCGGTDIIKKDGVYVCQICGTKYSVKEAKKLIVSIDNADLINKLINSAIVLQEKKDYKKAISIYDKVLDIDPLNNKALSEKENLKVFDKLNCYIIGVEPRLSLNPVESITSKPNSLIPYDFYENISDIIVKQKYLSFVMHEIRIKGNYSGTAGFKKNVKFTGYDYEYYNRQNGEIEKRRIPVIKNEIQMYKKPFNGSFNDNVIYSEYFGGDNIINSSTVTNVKNYLETNGIKYLRNISIPSIANKKIEIDNNMDIDIESMDDYLNKYINFEKVIKGRLKEKVDSIATKYRQGDETENFRYEYSCEILNSNIVLIPFEIIAYIYKGHKYYIYNLLCKNVLFNRVDFNLPNPNIYNPEFDLNETNIKNQIYELEEKKIGIQNLLSNEKKFKIRNLLLNYKEELKNKVFNYESELNSIDDKINNLQLLINQREENYERSRNEYINKQRTAFAEKFKEKFHNSGLSFNSVVTDENYENENTKLSGFDNCLKILVSRNSKTILGKVIKGNFQEGDLVKYLTYSGEIYKLANIKCILNSGIKVHETCVGDMFSFIFNLEEDFQFEQMSYIVN